MIRPLLISALTIATFMPVAGAQEGLVPVTPAIYHPALDHQSTVVRVDYSYRARRRRAYYRRRHRHHRAVKRIGLGAAGGAAIGAVAGGGKGALIGGAAGAAAGAIYNKHEEDKHRY